MPALKQQRGQYLLRGGSKMTEDKYFASDEAHEVELDRLNLISQIYDPLTIGHLKGLKIGPGWNCLEVGAGGGSVVRWLSERTGRGGRVVATDVDTRFLDQLGISNVEVRRHNIVSDTIEEDYYDLVHCRLVLMHITEYRKALEHMARAVKPGGWLLIEEPDFSSTRVNDSENPRAILHNEWNTGFLNGMKQKGIFDGFIGRHVRSFVEGLGFVDVGFEGTVPIYRGGELFARWILMNGDAILGKATDEKSIQILENGRVIFMDPSFYFTGPTFFSAWGRKPKEQRSANNGYRGE
jgi:SAM-dependent methyltransferase